MQRISIDRLRSKLGDVIRQCANSGEEVEVTVYGIPAVRIIPLQHVPASAVAHMEVPGQQELPFADNSKTRKTRVKPEPKAMNCA